MGIGIEVCYSKAGKLVRTKSNNDKTLSELNKWCESNGCDLIQGNKKISLKSGNEKKINKSKINLFLLVTTVFQLSSWKPDLQICE